MLTEVRFDGVDVEEVVEKIAEASGGGLLGCCFLDVHFGVGE